MERMVSDKHRYIIGVIASILLGLIFVLSGIGKLFANLPTETNFIENLSPIFRMNIPFIDWIPYILPWAEVLLGLCLLLQLWTPIIVIFFCVPLITCFLLNNYWMIISGMQFNECNNCFGIFESVIKLSPQAAFGVDIFMFLLCCIIAFVNQNYPILYGVVNGKEK